jgi:hypothetical protein
VGSSIDGVIVSVLTLSVVDRGFEHRWCNSKRAHFECSSPRSTTLKVSTLTITPPMLEPTIYYTQSKHAYYYTTDARTHDLLHSKSARLLLHHRCSNPRSTILKVSTLTITPSIDGVIVSVLTLSVVGRGFEHRSGEPDYKIGMYCFSFKGKGQSVEQLL